LVEVGGVDEKFHGAKVANPNGLRRHMEGRIFIKSSNMGNWTDEEMAEFERRVAIKLEGLEVRIAEYRELTKPIPPENAIGRVSRMDAINNRSVNEAALRTAERQKADLLRALDRLRDDKFGLCHACGERIPIGRMLLMPGATRCVRCAS
jgi:DnaK suppressor protein